MKIPASYYMTLTLSSTWRMLPLTPSIVKKSLADAGERVNAENLGNNSFEAEEYLESCDTCLFSASSNP